MSLSASEIRKRAMNLYGQSHDFLFQQNKPEIETFLKRRVLSDPLSIETEFIETRGELQEREKVMNADIEMEVEDRQHWESTRSFVIVSVCDALIIASISLVPGSILTMEDENCESILIPYLLLWIPFAISALSMEVSNGQIWQGSLFKVFSSIHYRTRAVGLVTAIICLHRIQEVTRFLSISILYIVRSFSKTMPWSIPSNLEMSCDNLGHFECNKLDHCISCFEDSPCTLARFKYAETFYNRTVVGLLLNEDTGAFSDLQTGFSVQIIVAYIVAVILINVLSKFSLSFISQLASYSVYGLILALITIVVDLRLAIGGSSLIQALKFLFSFSFNKMSHRKSNFTMEIVVVSMGLFSGTQYEIASHEKSNANLSTSLIYILLLRCSICIVLSTIIISLAGHSQLIVEGYMYDPKSIESSSWVFGSYEWCGLGVPSRFISFSSAHATDLVLYKSLPLCFGILQSDRFVAAAFYSMISVSVFVTAVIIHKTVLSCIENFQFRFFRNSSRNRNIIMPVLWVCWSLPVFINYSSYMSGTELSFLVSRVLANVLLPVAGILQIIAVALGIGYSVQRKMSRYTCSIWIVNFLLFAWGIAGVFVALYIRSSVTLFHLLGVLTTIIIALAVSILSVDTTRKMPSQVYNYMVGELEVFRSGVSSITTMSSEINVYRPPLIVILKFLVVPTLLYMIVTSVYHTDLNLYGLITGYILISVVVAGAIYHDKFSFLADRHWASSYRIFKYLNRDRVSAPDLRLPMDLAEEFYAPDDIMQRAVSKRK